jgi:DnaJ-class molecular chaperone
MAELYEELGLTKDATPDEVKAAFRRRAQATHPDKEGGSEAEFKTVKHAYEVLSDPARRKSYDETGSFDAQPTLEEEAEKTLANLFGQFLDHDTGGYPLASLREEITKVARVQKSDAKAAGKKAAKVAKLITNFKKKTDGNNLFQRVLQVRKAFEESRAVACQRNADVCAEMLRMLDDYEFTGEVAPTSQRGSMDDLIRTISNQYGAGQNAYR